MKAADDHSRIARAEIFPDQKKESAVAFLVATVAYFRGLGKIFAKFAALHMSGFGTKRTYRHTLALSALRGQADFD